MRVYLPSGGLAAYGLGFHVIESTSTDQGIKDMSNTALITITSGVVSAIQLENEFKVKRWTFLNLEMACEKNR